MLSNSRKNAVIVSNSNLVCDELSDVFLKTLAFLWNLIKYFEKQIYLYVSKMFKIENVHLFVKYYEETKTGVILCDFENPDKNARICTYVNVKRFKKLYFKTLKRMN